MLNFEPNGNALVRFEIISGDECQQVISLPLADYLALVERSRTLEELRILLLEWRPAEEKTKAATA
jgi:hypothetical protein